MVRRSGATLEAIWLTHGHLDHIGGIAGVLRVFAVPVHMHAADLPLYLRGAAAGRDVWRAVRAAEPPDSELADGDVLTLGSLSFEVMHLPGHSPGHVVLRQRRHRFRRRLALRRFDRTHGPAARRPVHECRSRWCGSANWATRPSSIPATVRARRLDASARRTVFSPARRALRGDSE